MTRTFSFGRPNICARTLRWLTTPCVDSYSVNVGPIPDRSRRVQLDRVVRLGRRDIGLVELDRCACESGVGVAALALQAGSRAKRGDNHFGIIVRFKLGLDVRLFLGVGHTNGIGRGFGGFERVRHSERDVLAVVANDIVLEGWAPLVA